MYSVVFFIKENTVDAVPSHWVKNNLCAWPKKHIKKSIKRKLQPNDLEYDYFPARVLKKHINSLEEARAKAKIAEQTSDLDHEVVSKPSRNRDGTTSLVEIPNPPTYKPDANEIDCDDKTAVSEDSDDIISRDPSFRLPRRNDLFSVSPSSCEKLENVTLYHKNQKPIISSKDDNILNQRARRHLDFEECLDQKRSNKVTPSSSLRVINYNASNLHMEEPHSEYSVPRSKTSEVSKVSYIHTLSSPFKVTNNDVSQIEKFPTSESNMNTRVQYENNYKSKGTITSVRKRSNENEQDATKRYNALEFSVPRTKTNEVSYIHTLSSPFKVTNNDVSHSRIEKFQTSESNMNTRVQYENNYKSKGTITSVCKRSNENEQYATKHYNALEYSVPRSTDEGDYIYTQASPIKVTSKVTQPTDMMQKILRAVLKTKDYVEANGERLDKIESFLFNSTSRSQNMNTTLYGVESENIFAEYFPIRNEVLLDEFERKLSERAFRSTVINEIKHYSKKDLVPTVREILRQMFHDELLKHYSYVGQKGKKNFSSLASCTVIIEAVKKMNNHRESTNAQISAPIKTYLSGAPSRLFEKSKLSQEKM